MNESNSRARGAYRALPENTRNRYHERPADRPVDATIWRKKAEAAKCGGATDEKEKDASSRRLTMTITCARRRFGNARG